MTMRRLHQRLKEHAKFEKSELNEHSIVCNHNIGFNCPSILATDKIRSRLSVKEALKIRETSAYMYLNRNIRGCDLFLW